MSDEVQTAGEQAPSPVYIYVGQTDDGWFWEARNSEHERIDGKGGFKSMQKAHQDGADTYPSRPDASIEARVGHDPTAGEE